MRLGRKVRRVAGGASVALATTGLSTCHDSGGVDPPPPPFECTNDVRSGHDLAASATLSGAELRVTIWGPGRSEWVVVEVTEVVGGTVRPVTVARPLEVVIDLADAAIREGSFRLTGIVEGVDGTETCSVGRTFQFRVEPETGAVVVARADVLPLSLRQPARIAVASRAGREVELVPGATLEGATTVAWTVTGGEILSSDRTHLRWRLPAAAGLYQVELVADHGERGFSYDTLVLEVL
jgi:hypothetical protein